MARIKIHDLPALDELSTEQRKGIFAGAGHRRQSLSRASGSAGPTGFDPGMVISANSTLRLFGPF